MREPARDTLAGRPISKGLRIEIEGVGPLHGAQHFAVGIGALPLEFILWAFRENRRRSPFMAAPKSARAVAGSRHLALFAASVINQTLAGRTGPEKSLVIQRGIRALRFPCLRRSSSRNIVGATPRGDPSARAQNSPGCSRNNFADTRLEFGERYKRNPKDKLGMTPIRSKQVAAGTPRIRSPSNLLGGRRVRQGCRSILRPTRGYFGSIGICSDP